MVRHYHQSRTLWKLLPDPPHGFVQRRVGAGDGVAEAAALLLGRPAGSRVHVLPEAVLDRVHCTEHDHEEVPLPRAYQMEGRGQAQPRARLQLSQPLRLSGGQHVADHAGSQRIATHRPPEFLHQLWRIREARAPHPGRIEPREHESAHPFRREGHGDIDDANASALAAQQAPEALAVPIPAVHEPDAIAVTNRRVEVEDAVPTRVGAGNEGTPGGRAVQRRHSEQRA